MSKKRRQRSPDEPPPLDDLSGIDEAPPMDDVPSDAVVVVKPPPDYSDLTDLQRGFKERAAREEQRFRDATDSEYWFCVVFASRDHKERFLRQTGLWEHGDKYLDGDVFADALGVDYDAEAHRPEWGPDRPPPDKLVRLTK